MNGCAHTSRLAFRGKAPPQSAERAYALGQALAVGIPDGGWETFCDRIVRAFVGRIETRGLFSLISARFFPRH